MVISICVSGTATIGVLGRMIANSSISSDTGVPYRRARARATSSSLQQRSASVSTSTLTPNDWSPKTSGPLR